MNEFAQSIYKAMNDPQSLRDQSPPLGLILNQQTLEDIRKWDNSPYVDWRIKFLNVVPECFMYHDSIDKALNEYMIHDSLCYYCGKEDCWEDCQDENLIWYRSRILSGEFD